MHTHTHTHTHVHKRIDVQIHTHMHIYTYIHVRIHTHIHIYIHTHTKCTYELHASTPGTTARQRTCKEPLQTKEALHFLSFDAIKPHFAPPNKDFIVPTSCSSNTSIPHPLFLAYPTTVRSLRSFTMALCVVVERLKGKQRCSRAAVSEYAGIQAQERSR